MRILPPASTKGQWILVLSRIYGVIIVYAQKLTDKGSNTFVLIYENM